MPREFFARPVCFETILTILSRRSMKNCTGNFKKRFVPIPGLGF